MRKVIPCFVFGLLLATAGLCQTQTPAEGDMTLDDLRQYFALMHMKEADTRSIQAQMHTQMAKFPEWWHADVTDAMTTAMLSVDVPPLQYPFVKSCMSSPDVQAVMALFKTPEGQGYVNQAVAAMAQPQPVDAGTLQTRPQQVAQDKAIPPAALQSLTADQRERVLRVLKGNAIQCMNSGFAQAVPVVGQTRGDLAKKVIQDHQAEMQAAKTKHDLNQGAPKE